MDNMTSGSANPEPPATPRRPSTRTYGASRARSSEGSGKKFAVTLRPSLAKWVESVAATSGKTKSQVIEQCVLRTFERRIEDKPKTSD
ncbi:MAG: hypothetical protein EOO38_11495 [Cytophagaceae bacterium]|nr:MAG: hypothetical protein EOO38_11495 [Cytophagaceae bacterium]